MEIKFKKNFLENYRHSYFDETRILLKSHYSEIHKGYVEYNKENPNDLQMSGYCFEKNIQDALSTRGHKCQLIEKDTNELRNIRVTQATSSDRCDIKYYHSDTNTVVVGSCKFKEIGEKSPSTIPLTKTDLMDSVSKMMPFIKKKNPKKVIITLATHQMMKLKSYEEIYNEHMKDNPNYYFEHIIATREVYDSIPNEIKEYALTHRMTFTCFEDEWERHRNAMSQFDYNMEFYFDNMYSDTPLVVLRKSQKDMVDAIVAEYKNCPNQIILIDAIPRFGKTIVCFSIYKAYMLENFGYIKGFRIGYQTNYPAIFPSVMEDIYKVFSPDEVNVITDNLSSGSYNENKLNIYLFSSQYTAYAKVLKDDIIDLLNKLDGYVFDEAHIGIDTDNQKKVQKIIKKLRKSGKNVPVLLMSGTPNTLFLSNVDRTFSFNLMDRLDYDETGEDKDMSNFPLGVWLGFDYNNPENYDANTVVPVFDSIHEVFNTKNISYCKQLFNSLCDMINGGLDTTEHLNTTHQTYPHVWNFAVPGRMYARNFLVFCSNKDELKIVVEALKSVNPAFNAKVKCSTSDINSSEEAVFEANEFFDSNIDGYYMCFYCVVGQLTTGVTIKNCHGVILANDCKSYNKVKQSCYRANNPHKDKYGVDMPYSLWINLSVNNMFEMFHEQKKIAIRQGNPKLIKEIEWQKNMLCICQGGSIKKLSMDEVDSKIHEVVTSQSSLDRRINSQDTWITDDELKGFNVNKIDGYDFDYLNDKPSGLSLQFQDKTNGNNAFTKIVNTKQNPNYNPDIEKTPEELEKEKEELITINKVLAFLNKIRCSLGHILQALKNSKDIETLKSMKNGNFEENVSLWLLSKIKDRSRYSLYFSEPVFQNNFKTYLQLSTYIGRYIDLKRWEDIYNDVIDAIIESIKQNKTIDLSALMYDKSRSKKIGEVFTPINLVNLMLNLLPSWVWSNPSLKFLDNCMGSGIFLLEIKRRLMEGLKDVFPDEKEREKHIIENMLYGIELDEKNWILAYDSIMCGNNYSCHLELADALTFDYWGGMKFDIIVGNPPYNDSSKGKGRLGSYPLWIKFDFKYFELLKEQGYLCLVHPSLWRDPNDSKGIGKLLKSKNMLYLNMNSAEDGLKTFGATTRYDYFLIKNEPYQGNTIINDVNSKEFNWNLNNYSFVPNGCFDDFSKLIANENENKVELLYSRSIYGTDKNWMNKDKTTDYVYPCIYYIPDANNLSLWYSNNQNGMFNEPKICFCSGVFDGKRIYPDKNGDYGLTQFCFGLKYDVNEIDDIMKVLKSKKFNQLAEMTFISKTELNKNVIRLFKKDWWKEDIFNDQTS